MSAKNVARSTGRWFAIGAALAAAGYASWAAYAWLMYGHPQPPASGQDRDSLLDRFMPHYDVVERHHVNVDAPAAVTFEAATEMNLLASPAIRAIFRARELVLRTDPTPPLAPGSFIDQMKAIGWGVLAEVTGREIVMGAVTQPWMGNVVFRALTPAEFAAFAEPDYVKIVWTLRADAIGPVQSMFRTETRVSTTDRVARAKFRRYWSLASPGIVLIRKLSLQPLKADAERRARARATVPTTEFEEPEASHA
jgi:hypothetical protein